ncbi:salicylate 1-monooxygenase [Fusarium mundagurra]|uniref:Salicylate 1-monooxygenase n=1 Tax=Fusarium mundagurra TaxID=1567541 RepID=A0A8H5YNM9_9HYPO|nr:salicylate 1-monooxygenase [Fusarium mundagurra]
MGSMPELHVVIVGGGIAGLATAFALRHPNRRITVLERSRLLREVGALISLQPNASKIITKWKLDPFLETAEPQADQGFRIFDADGNLVRELPFQKGQFGAERMLYHRQDLQAALGTAAASEEAYGNPVDVRTGCQVASVDCDEGIVTLDSGEKIHGDLIIGADGIHSVVRTAVVGEKRNALPTGTSAYRMLIPTENLEGLSLPSQLLDPRVPKTTMIMGHDRRVIMGPGRNSKLYGIVALVPDEKLTEESSDSWVAPGSIEKLLEAYSDFPSWLHDIFKAAPDIGLWQLRDIDPLPRWVKGRTILIGDAAHAMLPTQGQGASQSVEDAEAVCAFLANVQSRDEVGAALERVFAARYDRASLIQKFSREQAKPATDGVSKKVNLDPAQFMRYNCDYNGAEDWEQRQKNGTANP